MNAQTLAQRAYGQSSQSTRTPRSTEYDLIARVTYGMRKAAQGGRVAFPDLVKALSDNQRLWTTLATDVAGNGNALPQDLRARIFYLAEFVQQHTAKVLTEDAGIKPLVEINAAILRGLAQGEVAE